MKEKNLNKIIDIIRRHIKEEVPVMALAHGNIAGTVEAGDDPPVRRKKTYIYQKGLRKTWSPQNGRRT